MPSTREAPTPGHATSEAGPDRLGRAAAAVVALVTVISVVRAFGPLTYPGDLWRQTDTASIARNFARNGLQLFYPQINWGGAGPGYVETELPLMPWLTALLYRVFGEHDTIGRLVSLAFMLVATAAFWGLARRLLAPDTARFAVIAFVVSPVFLRWGTAFMPEATVLAFSLLTLYAFCRWLQEDRMIWLVAAAAAMSAAALAKPTSLHLGLVLAGWLLLGRAGVQRGDSADVEWQRSHPADVQVPARTRLRRPSVYVAGVAALVAPALWFWHAARLHAEYGNTFGVLSGGDSKWGSVALWLTPAFYLGNLKTELIFVYGIVGVPLAVLGAVWAWRHRPAAFPLLVAGAVALVIYYAAVGRYSGSDLGVQYHVYSLPYAALAIGLGLAAAARWLAPRVRPVLFGLAVTLAVGALFLQSGNVFLQSIRSNAGQFGECAEALTQVSAPGDLVVVATTSATVEDGVANNFQEPVVFYLADRKGWSLAADQTDPGLLASYRDQGARFLVSPDSSLVPAGGPRAAWLAANATPVDIGTGCGVWALGSA